MTSVEQNKRARGSWWWLSVAALALMLAPATTNAAIPGITGTNFTLTASEGYVSVADGGSIYSWGYAEGMGGVMQLPGPTLIVSEGDMVTVTLYNALPAAAGNVSIVFPGHTVMTMGGVPGLLTQEAPPGGSVQYSFTAASPGTYQYHSGTRPDLQVEMGLYGALIVEPTTTPMGCSASAYNHGGTCFDREFLFLLSEIDIDIHQAAELEASGSFPMQVATEPYNSEYWLINGRVAPDTMAEAGTGLLPHQPYNCMPRMHPGERLLLRVVGVGRQMHPFHTHGNHARLLARDGGLIVSATDATELAGPLLFTVPSVPGQTADAVFEWTGKDLGWDVYGLHPNPDHNTCNGVTLAQAITAQADPGNPANAVTLAALASPEFDAATNEYCADHGKPIPVTLPDLSVLTFGGFYGGSAYLGDLGSLPPGEGGLNPDAGFAYMWHSHTERELVNNDVFPGGMLTMLIIEAPWVTISE